MYTKSCRRVNKGLKTISTDSSTLHVLGLDTEFIRQNTFWPQLSLIQYHDGEKAVILDGLKDDLSPCKEILLNPHIIKIIHSARQDLEIFYQLWGVVVQPIFDTQIAARLCGLGQEMSLFQLVKDIFGVELEKGVQFSDWLKRPLTPEQLSYAEQDVTHLIPLYHILKQQLEDQGKFQEFLIAQEGLLRPETYEAQPEKAWQRVKGYKQLSEKQKSWLKVIAAWREVEAAFQNKIRRLILSDELLIKIAIWQPQREDKLSKITHKLATHQVAALWQMIQEAGLLKKSDGMDS